MAVKVSENAYAPYSHFHVGAALLCGDGTIATGVNVENRVLRSYKLCRAFCRILSSFRREKKTSGQLRYTAKMLIILCRLAVPADRFFPNFLIKILLFILQGKIWISENAHWRNFIRLMPCMNWETGNRTDIG